MQVAQMRIYWQNGNSRNKEQIEKPVKSTTESYPKQQTITDSIKNGI